MLISLYFNIQVLLALTKMILEAILKQKTDVANKSGQSFWRKLYYTQASTSYLEKWHVLRAHFQKQLLSPCCYVNLRCLNLSIHVEHQAWVKREREEKYIYKKHLQSLSDSESLNMWYPFISKTVVTSEYILHSIQDW